jgi:2,3-dihydroxybenzoate decarboxylase
MVRKIALEEHFLHPDFIEYWNPTVIDLPQARRDNVLTRLTDFGELRLAAMEEAGIAHAVLGLAGPGVQAERDTATAVRRARSANDFLVRQIERRPDRYSGFAHLPMQDALAVQPSSNAVCVNSNFAAR